MRFILTMLAIALAMPICAGFAVYEPEHGYSKRDRQQMGELIERSIYGEDYISQLEVALYRNGGKL